MTLGRKSNKSRKKITKDIGEDIIKVCSSVRNGTVPPIGCHNTVKNESNEAVGMTNCEKFVQLFGLEAWTYIIVAPGIYKKFKDFWASPYKKG